MDEYFATVDREKLFAYLERLSKDLEKQPIPDTLQIIENERFTKGDLICLQFMKRFLAYKQNEKIQYNYNCHNWLFCVPYTPDAYYIEGAEGKTEYMDNDRRRYIESGYIFPNIWQIEGAKEEDPEAFERHWWIQEMNPRRINYQMENFPIEELSTPCFWCNNNLELYNTNKAHEIMNIYCKHCRLWYECHLKKHICYIESDMSYEPPYYTENEKSYLWSSEHFDMWYNAYPIVQSIYVHLDKKKCVMNTDRLRTSSEDMTWAYSAVEYRRKIRMRHFFRKWKKRACKKVL